MDALRFDRLTRSLSARASRRAALGGTLATLGLGSLVPAGVAKKKKLQKNAFGCVNVGKPCRGKDKNCCSGICKGNKPKKGEKDKSKCLAHDQSTCQAGQQPLVCGGADVPCTSTSGLSGACVTTTGNGAYCANNGVCSSCKRDADCTSRLGANAACVPCAKECAGKGDMLCVGTLPFSP